jgi:DNA-binding GntR family transcriptional regulator
MHTVEPIGNGKRASLLTERSMVLLDNAPIAIRAADYLESEIVAGQLAPGAHLGQEDMALKLGISRGALREAFNIVAGRGLLEIIPRKGVFVRTFTARQVENIYAVRCALEQLAAAIAASKLKASDVAESRVMMRAMKSSMEQSDVHSYLEANIQLHRLLFKWADNEVLTESYARLSNPLHALRLSSLSLPHSLEESYSEHVAIMEAMAEGDVDGASERIAAHLRRGADKVKRHMAEIAAG